jgi:hypothetical protein
MFDAREKTKREEVGEKESYGTEEEREGKIRQTRVDKTIRAINLTAQVMPRLRPDWLHGGRGSGAGL